MTFVQMKLFCHLLANKHVGTVYFLKNMMSLLPAVDNGSFFYCFLRKVVHGVNLSYDTCAINRY